MNTIITRIIQRLNREKTYNTKEYWDHKSETYENMAISLWPNRFLNDLQHADQLNMIDKLLPSKLNKRILDIGCGMGRMSQYFAHNGAYVTGIDFSEKTIQKAKQLSGGKHIMYRVESLFTIADTDYYDMALALGVLTIACPDKKTLALALASIRKSLRSGADFLIIEPIHRGFLHRVLNMNLATFEHELTESGFQIHSVHNLHFWPARILLCHFPLPKQLTHFVYGLGSRLMKLNMFKKSGDYKVIYCTKK